MQARATAPLITRDIILPSASIYRHTFELVKWDTHINVMTSGASATFLPHHPHLFFSPLIYTRPSPPSPLSLLLSIAPRPRITSHCLLSLPEAFLRAAFPSPLFCFVYFRFRPRRLPLPEAVHFRFMGRFSPHTRSPLRLSALVPGGVGFSRGRCRRRRLLSGPWADIGLRGRRRPGSLDPNVFHPSGVFRWVSDAG